MDNSIIVTVISSITPSTLSKQYKMIDGELEKTTMADMSEGFAETKILANLHEFAGLLKSLNHNQALTYGLPLDSPTNLITKQKFHDLIGPKGYLTRTKDHFDWSTHNSGILMLDYDPAKDDKPKSMEELLEILHTVVPELIDAPYVWWCSSSSHIIDEQDNDLTGLKGQRIYIPVIDATDIPRSGKALVELLWSAGFGKYEIGKAGQFLERCPFDASVWQANRLDFASGAYCISPLRQDRGQPIVVDGSPIDSLIVIPEPTDLQKSQASSNRVSAKADKVNESESIKSIYIEEKAIEMTKGSADKALLEQARATIKRALDSSVLAGEFPIVLANGETFTVSEILDNNARFHGVLTRDPIEPDYSNNKVVGKLYLIGGRPYLYSFAHGGKKYNLIRQPRKIELIKGRTHDVVLETLTLLQQLPDVYDFGEALVLISDGQAIPFDEAYFTHWLGGQVQYWHWAKTSQGLLYEVLDDPQPKIVKPLLSMNSKRGLKPLEAVITALTLRRDGSVIDTLGYDAISCIYVDLIEPPLPIPKKPLFEQVSEALDILMYPFKDFAFCTPLDRSIMLCALLTACLRPTLDTAPGFGFDAPVQGSGKSLLAACVGVLATGFAPTVWPHTAARDDEEVRKRIFTALRSGTRCLIWDNVTGVFDSASLASALTSSNFTDRVLGKSEALTVPNRAIFIMTGNNLCLAGDMPRRILICRINAETETPFNRIFDLNPLQYVKEHRQKMARAALIIVRGWLTSKEYNHEGSVVTGSMGGFELWDKFVRQPVIWINQFVAIGRYSDPMEAVINAQANDPERDVLSELLVNLHEIFKGSSFTAKDVIEKCNLNQYPQNSLNEILADIGNGKAQFSPRSIGKTLSVRQDKIVNGLCLSPVTKSNNTNRWKVSVVS
jgi:hypothetical protein